MATTYQTVLVVAPMRFRQPETKPDVIIGGRRYQYDELGKQDWAAANQNEVNKIDNKQCR